MKTRLLSTVLLLVVIRTVLPAQQSAAADLPRAKQTVLGLYVTAAEAYQKC